ncbi:hypothetical protein KC669_05040 [Candidatus Dojkabacteria bacterium]|uniref:Uncharacterized protein n=1 Tax=Candidatus Dojkabacteria bacterium TaxID=2099670 RepID=A0A955RLS4_9BACT|nr:hypothetical protein [Candidatus Dojkabacteria bacterium]
MESNSDYILDEDQESTQEFEPVTDSDFLSVTIDSKSRDLVASEIVIVEHKLRVQLALRENRVGTKQLIHELRDETLGKLNNSVDAKNAILYLREYVRSLVITPSNWQIISRMDSLRKIKTEYDIVHGFMESVELNSLPDHCIEAYNFVIEDLVDTYYFEQDRIKQVRRESIMKIKEQLLRSQSAA